MIHAASAIILQNNKILLIKRSSYTKTFPNTWACPGGRGNDKETPKETVIRKLKEETNLHFKPKRLFKTGMFEDRELFRFLGEWSGNIKIQEEEITEYNWFTYKDAIKLDLGFDYREVIELLHKEKLI